MKNKVKEMMFFLAFVLLIAFLGLTPVVQKKTFALNWGNLGLRMIEAGVIDGEKFENLYKSSCRIEAEL